ncbi:hypothetical protein WN943_029116 [Citrus x changshan-huyou]
MESKNPSSKRITRGSIRSKLESKKPIKRAKSGEQEQIKRGSKLESKKSIHRGSKGCGGHGCQARFQKVVVGMDVELKYLFLGLVGAKLSLSSSQ